MRSDRSNGNERVEAPVLDANGLRLRSTVTTRRYEYLLAGLVACSIRMCGVRVYGFR